MNKLAIEWVQKYSKDQGYPDLRDAEDYYGILLEENIIYEKKISDFLQWSIVFRVISLNGELIGYEALRTISDETINDEIWTFDPNTICFVKIEEKYVKQIKYLPIEELDD